MSRIISKEDLKEHKERSINSLSSYLDKLISSDDPNLQGKADKLSFWIQDWAKFLDYESEFVPSHLRRYKRGEIIKAHLGFNIGSEEGGLHYCVIMDKNNSINSPVITVIPLTSVKATTDLQHLRQGNVYLGNELFTSLNSKLSHNLKIARERSNALYSTLHALPEDCDMEIRHDYEQQMKSVSDTVDFCERMQKEVNKMKQGSIALVKQIRTISKIRIYDPKTNYDVLSNVKLSNEKLDLLDTEIIRNFTK